MKLGLRYETIYRYEQPVGFSPHEVRLFPRPDRFSRVNRLDFKTTPESNVRFVRDVFDNTIASCFFAETAPELRIELAIDLELEPKDPFHFILHESAVDLPFAYERDLIELLAAYRRPTTSKQLDISGWKRPTRDDRRGTVTSLVEFNRAIHESIGYERRETGAAHAPEETLRLGRGACRDVAALAAELLRQSGLAARLTSGYLRETDGDARRAEGSLHAWTEVFLPGAGWVGLDGTNGVFCNHNFIAAAVGLTPPDITPIHGNYLHETPVSSQMTSRLELINL
ncbi:MAG: transglutaminase family protein [Chthoniobacterales bacterium]